MTSFSRVCRGVKFAGAALLALLVIAPGCGRPPDEAWLRVHHFEDPDVDGQEISHISSAVWLITPETVTTDATTTPGTTDYVNVVFANQSTVVGMTEANAGGVTVDRVRISYAIAGYSPPGAAYSVTLYVPAHTDGSTTTNTKMEVALVSTALKSWLADTVPKSVLANGLDASARLVFHARTDEGGELETEAGIGIVFENKTVTIP